MSGIRQWLDELGLGQYVEAFEANDIDLALLPQVDDQMLKDIGVASGGHRLRLRSAIAKLPSAPGRVAMGDAKAGVQAEVGALARAYEAERRQLTVMFCDLVGSTELSRRLDPEELRRLIREYQDVCVGAISRFEGHVAQYLGDGVLAYFGYPVALEGGAERAIRAGLTVVERVRELSTQTGQPLQVRIGIDTGLVVIGQGDALNEQERTAIGDVPNIAARLQALAVPDSVVVSERTRVLAADAFEYADLGEQSIKGIAEPVHAWQAQAERRSDTRFDARAVGVAPMVGRDFEYATLRHAWERAKAGKGQMVLLCGEPGIGKSRLIHALREQLASDGFSVWQYQCSPYFASSALYPVIEQLERALRFDRRDTAESKLDKLDALLARFGRPAEDASLIARLLGLPADTRYGAMALAPQTQRDETIRALHDVVQAAASEQPLLLLFEDLHWADPTTLESIDSLRERLGRMAVLLVATHRPEFRPPAVGKPGVTAMTLSRLDPQQTEAIALRVAGVRLPAGVVGQIVAKTDGVPLFVEELTKTVLEAGVLRREADRYELTAMLPAVQIPSTLHDSLLARLDRLAPVKELAQIAACIGREFDYELLAAVAPDRAQGLAAALDQLVATQLLQARGRPPAAMYTFTHALVQDAAYSTLLRSRRAQLHAAIAEVIRARGQDGIAFRPEILAYHYTQAGMPEQAVPLWLEAGQTSFQRAAASEAVSQLQEGLAQLRSLADSPERDRVEIDFQALLGAALIQSRGLASSEARAAFERARHLCQLLGRTEHLFLVFWGMFVTDLIGGRPRQALSVATELDAMARGDEKLQLVAQTALMDAEFWVGNLERARLLAQEALRRCRDEEALAQLATYSFDMKSINLVYASHIEWMLGYPDRARQYKARLDRWVRELNNPFMYAFAYTWGASAYHYTGELDTHRQQIEEGWRISREIGFPHFEKQAEVWVGWSRIVRGDHDQSALALIIDGIDQYIRTGSGIAVPYWHLLRAHALSYQGASEEALAALGQARDLAESTGDHAHLAEIHRLTGDVWISSHAHNTQRAEAAYRESLAVARRQKARGWELRTATSLARLWQSQGKRREAHDLLQPIYAWFTEGFDTRDLKEAKALPEGLAP
jgi:class 3 adenylate cyclase/predicted ATPase